MEKQLIIEEIDQGKNKLNLLLYIKEQLLLYPHFKINAFNYIQLILEQEQKRIQNDIQWGYKNLDKIELEIKEREMLLKSATEIFAILSEAPDKHIRNIEDADKPYRFEFRLDGESVVLEIFSYRYEHPNGWEYEEGDIAKSFSVESILGILEDAEDYYQGDLIKEAYEPVLYEQVVVRKEKIQKERSSK